MRTSRGERIFYVFNYIILSIGGLSCFLPLLHLWAISLSSEHAINSGFVTFWPVDFGWDAYVNMIKGTYILKAMVNSVTITVIGTAMNLVFTIAAAYPLSRSYFVARRPILLAIVFTMLFSGGLIPNYLLISQLGLVNTYWAIWLPGLVSAYNMLIMHTFFQNIPSELEDAARIDGCGEWRMILAVILPLSLPVIATITLFYGVGHWNAFFNVLIYINDTQKMNLSVQVQQMIQSNTLLQELSLSNPDEVERLTPESLKAAGIMFMVIPMLIVYPFLQRYFVKGVMLGSIKG